MLWECHGTILDSVCVCVFVRESVWIRIVQREREREYRSRERAYYTIAVTL